MADYYKVLNVSHTASDQEIKKAYKKLALRWHPDKNQDNLEEANNRFRELSEAYDVLSDHKKRRSYDMFGKDGLLRDVEDQSSSRFHTHSFADFGDMESAFIFRQPEEIFFEFFGASSPFAAMFAEHDDSADTDFLMASMSFPTFSNFVVSGGSVAGTSGDVMRTSTTTTFVNGKKLTTSKCYENGKETVLAYENDVLKSKTVNGVPQKVSAIKKQKTSKKLKKKL